MAGAGRALLLLVAVALPLLVQGFIPVNTYRRQRGDHPAVGDGWRRSSSLGGAGDVQPVHHLPKNFRHRFIHRHGKVLLENAEGRPQGFELHSKDPLPGSVTSEEQRSSEVVQRSALV